MTEYIITLSAERQAEILRALTDVGLDEFEILMAMSGRLCDIADTIDIK